MMWFRCRLPLSASDCTEPRSTTWLRRGVCRLFASDRTGSSPGMISSASHERMYAREMLHDDLDVHLSPAQRSCSCSLTGGARPSPSSESFSIYTQGQSGSTYVSQNEPASRHATSLRDGH